MYKLRVRILRKFSKQCAIILYIVSKSVLIKIKLITIRNTQAVFIILSDVTESVRGPQHRRASLQAESKHRGRCRHNPNLTPIMEFLWRDTGISQRCRTSIYSNQGLSRCFPTRVSQIIVRGSARNGKINK